jgi:hypothetical protein
VKFADSDRAQPEAAQRQLEQCTERFDPVDAGCGFELQREALAAGLTGVFGLANYSRSGNVGARTTAGPLRSATGPFPFSVFVCRRRGFQ